jgi:ParB family chromosome partitioning protein
MKKGLGRGFGSLIPTEDFVEEAFDVTADIDRKVSELSELSLDAIFPADDQPRRHFDEAELNALANSIIEHGVLQPIVVVRDGKQYKIVAGERRWRASRIAGLATIPAIVRTLDDQNRLELSLIENVQRADLNAIEIATAYAKFKTQFNLTAKQIATKVGKSESAVINTMRLLNLPEDAKLAMVDHGLSEGQMRPLITVKPEIVSSIIPRIIDEGWSSRRVEQYLTELKSKGQVKHRGGRVVSSAYTDEASAISSKVGGAPTEIKVSARGSGQIVIRFKTEKELKQIIKQL